MPQHEPGALFDDYAADWDARPTSPEVREKLALVAEAGAPPPDSTLLDVGTGTGVLIATLLAYEPEVIWACDVSGEMLKRAQAKFDAEARVRFVKADAADLGLPDASVDAAFWNALFPHLDDPQAALREAQRVLRPGGRLVISHVMGRGHVNTVHHEAGGPLRHHVLPPAAHVSGTLGEAGFDVTRSEDTDALYLIVGHKREVA